MKKLILPVLLLFMACEEGQLLDNLPPETQLFLTEINLSGPDRLNSVLDISWSGEDQDGYVKGYELSFDQTTWKFVTTQDSTFRFDISPGSDTTDIDFYVRAIDDKELADPSPAYLRIPIKNAPPVARLDTLKTVPDTVNSVFSLLWTVNDLDGNETLDSTFLRINNGPWYRIETRITFATFVPEAPMSASEQAAKVYADISGQLLPLSIQGLRVGESNRMYLRTRDISGTYSVTDSSNTFFVKRQSGDLLLVDAHTSPDADEVYFPILSSIYPTYDYIDLQNNQPLFWEPAFGLYLGLYDKVFWYSDGTEIPGLGLQLLMEVGANQLQLYLNQGGKLFTTAQFPNSFTNDPTTANTSAVFSFSPMDSLPVAFGQARIPIGNLVVPMGDLTGNSDTLEASRFITGADPFYPKNAVNSLYTAQLILANGSPWPGPPTVCSRSVFANGRTNQVFFSIELHKLNGRPDALQNFFDWVLNEEFAW
jgi:hypothetical protein